MALLQTAGEGAPPRVRSSVSARLLGRLELEPLADKLDGLGQDGCA
jgi:hypothetical protein